MSLPFAIPNPNSGEEGEEWHGDRRTNRMEAFRCAVNGCILLARIFLDAHQQPECNARDRWMNPSTMHGVPGAECEGHVDER